MYESLAHGSVGALNGPKWVQQSKMIRENSPNRPKTHKLENLVFMAKDEKTIRRNSSVSNEFTFFMRILKVFSFTSQGNIFI